LGKDVDNACYGQIRRVIPINRNERKDDTWKMVALYGSLSLNLGLMILGGYYLGELCENQFEWSNMKITGILSGLFLGLYQMFTFAYRATKKK
jgi:hypothetical protein